MCIFNSQFPVRFSNFDFELSCQSYFKKRNDSHQYVIGVFHFQSFLRAWILFLVLLTVFLCRSINVIMIYLCIYMAHSLTKQGKKSEQNSLSAHFIIKGVTWEQHNRKIPGAILGEDTNPCGVGSGGASGIRQTLLFLLNVICIYLFPCK